MDEHDREAAREQEVEKAEQPETEADAQKVDGEIPASAAGDDLGGVRELILRAYPDAVAEMVAGETVEAMLASVPAAREAYSRIAARVRDQSPATIPTGAGRRSPIDPEGLSPESKIRAGLRQPRSS